VLLFSHQHPYKIKGSIFYKDYVNKNLNLKKDNLLNIYFNNSNMNKNSIALIAALAKNYCIGNNNDLPWKHGYLSGYENGPSDFELFKQNTMGKPLIMFRNTWESLPGILPGRNHIVVSRNIKRIPQEHQRLFKVESLEEGIALASKNYDGEIMLIGGAQLYKLALHKKIPNRMYLSHVKEDFKGDTYFPRFNEDEWKITEELDCNQFIYRIWDRK
jgi:dihydrofolate reductase